MQHFGSALFLLLASTTVHAELSAEFQRSLQPVASDKADNIRRYRDRAGNFYYVYPSGQVLRTGRDGWHKVGSNGEDLGLANLKGGPKNITEKPVERWLEEYDPKTGKLIRRLEGDEVSDPRGECRDTNSYDKIGGPYELPFVPAGAIDSRTQQPIKRRYDFVATKYGSPDPLHPRWTEAERPCMEEQKKINRRFAAYLAPKMTNWIRLGFSPFNDGCYWDADQGRKYSGHPQIKNYAQVDKIRLDAMPFGSGPRPGGTKSYTANEYKRSMTYPTEWRGANGTGPITIQFKPRRGFVVNAHVGRNGCVTTGLNELLAYMDVIDHAITRGKGDRKVNHEFEPEHRDPVLGHPDPDTNNVKARDGSGAVNNEPTGHVQPGTTNSSDENMRIYDNGANSAVLQ